MYNFLTVI